MKLPSLNSISPLEVVLFVIFLLYLIFPISTPPMITPYINSNIGMALVILITLYMLFYTTPILGILTVFVAYVLLYRSSSGEVKQKVKMVKHTPSQPRKDREMVKMNPPKEISLEEEVINEKAPIGKGSTPDGFIESSFKPIHDTILGGSLV
jgi:hypothetical protein